MTAAISFKLWYYKLPKVWNKILSLLFVLQKSIRLNLTFWLNRCQLSIYAISTAISLGFVQSEEHFTKYSRLPKWSYCLTNVLKCLENPLEHFKLTKSIPTITFYFVLNSIPIQLALFFLKVFSYFHNFLVM